MDKVKAARLAIRNLSNFIVFAMPLVFFQPMFDPFGPPQLMVARVFVPLLAVVFILKSMLDGRIVLKFNPVTLPAALYLLVCLVSVFSAINKPVSIKYVSEMSVFTAGAYLFFNTMERNDVGRLVFMIVLSHTLMAFYGISQHFGADLFSWNTNFGGRPLGTIGNPDFFAGEMLVSAFIVLSYALFGKKYRQLAWISFGAHLLCIYYTKVAGAYIGFTAGTIVFAFVFFNLKKGDLIPWIKANIKVIMTASLIICIAAGTAGFISSGKIKTAIQEKKRSLVHRMLMWESSLIMFRESPVIGKGFGNFRLYFPYYQAKLLNDPKNNEYDYVVTWMPHENYLLIASETGIAGLGLFVLAVFVFFKVSFKALRGSTHPAIPGFVAAISALLGASFFNTFYNIPATTFVFFLVIFLQHLFSGEQKAYVVKGNYAAYILAAAIAVLFLFLLADAKTIAANMYLKKGDSFSKREMLKEAAENYEKVISLEPVELCPQTDVAQYYYLAEVYRKAGNVKQAAEYYRKDLDLNPYCPEVNNMLGAAEGQLGNLPESIKRLELAVYVAPHYEAAYTNLATAYIAGRDYDSAERTLKKFVEKNGPNQNMENLLKELYRIKAAGQHAR